MFLNLCNMSNFKANLYPFLFALLASLIVLLIQDSFMEYLYTSLVILGILIVLVFFGEALFRYLIAIIRKKVFTPFIYDSIHTTLEFIEDNGKIVSHYTAVNISQLVWWKKQTSFRIFTEEDKEGYIEPEDGIGANVELYSQTKKELKYNVGFKKNNVFKKQHYFSSSCRFYDVFDQEESNFWDIPTKHFCKFYKLKLIFPDPNMKIRCQIVYKPKVSDNSDDNWKEITDPNLTSFIRYGKKVMNIVLVKIDNSKVYRVKWSKEN